MTPYAKSKKYIDDVLSGKEDAPKYVKKQCEIMKPIFDGTDPKYCVSRKKVRQIDGFAEFMIMPKGLSAGKTVREAFMGFQWFFILSALAVVHRDEPQKRKHERVLLEIARKNGKTFVIAVLFILLLFMEPRFSKFYSVAPDGKLSREVYTAIKEIIKMSPVLSQEVPKRFKVMRDKTVCLPTDSEYIPLNYSNDRLDGKQPSVFLVDEAGALPNSYAIEAMRSGQLTVINRLGFVISTKYPRVNNPFEDEISYAKRVLDGIENDEKMFALLYEPDDTVSWANNDSVLRHANPLAAHVPEIWEELLSKRKRAIVMRSAQENFLCKHCNIAFSAGSEGFVSVEDLRRGKVEHIDWTGRQVYLGLDLAMSEDNCSYAMVARSEDGGVYAQAVAFIPEDRIDEKSEAEKLDYRRFIEAGVCFACGDRIVDYGFIEEAILSVEKRFGVKVLGFGFDRYNCMSTAQKLEAEGGFIGTEVVQHSRTLHAPTKWLAELVAEGKFHYTENLLYEANFENARCTYDTNMNRYVNKKKSNGKIDMVAATINALYLLQQDDLGYMDWAVQGL